MGGEPHSETLFLPSRDPKGERWHGPRADPQAAGRGPAAGFAAVADLAALNKAVREALTPAREVYGLLPRRHPSYGQQPEPDFTKRLKELAPGREIRDLRATVSRMRSVKSPGEVRLIQKAIDASVAAHKAAWRETREHIRERHLAGVMFSQILRHGCSRFAYAPIVGGGFNSTVLHYSKLDAELRKGDVVLIDVGGEYSHYAADITRTAPVSGSFTKRQRKIYEIVLGAQEAVIRAIRPGMRLAGEGPASLQSIAKQYLDSHGDKRLGRPLGEAMIHGVGHHVGLAVHDPVDPETPLEPGMVITVEPGVYLPEEEIGIRIEDMLLVTERGASLLTSGLPRQAEDVGRWVSRAD